MASETTVDPRPSRRPFNPPRFRGALRPISANAELYAKVCEAFGSAQKLATFCKAFIQHRFESTGWRSMKDVSSKDTKHASNKPGVAATEALETPHDSLTATMAAIVAERTSDAIKLTRDESLSVIAALADDRVVVEAAGLRIWDAVNERLEYATLGMAGLEPGQIPDSAKALAQKLGF